MCQPMPLRLLLVAQRHRPMSLGWLRRRSLAVL
jgi:hypothetical protein